MGYDRDDCWMTWGEYEDKFQAAGVSDPLAEIARLTAERDQYLKSSVEYGNLSEQLRAELVLLHHELSTANNAHREMAKQLADMGREREGLRSLLEDAVDTLESMDLHVDNPLYDRLREGLERTFEQSAIREKA